MAPDLVGAGNIRPHGITDGLIGPWDQDLREELVVDGGDARLDRLEFRLDHQQQRAPALSYRSVELLTPRGLGPRPSGRGAGEPGTQGIGQREDETDPPVRDVEHDGGQVLPLVPTADEGGGAYFSSVRSMSAREA